MDVIVHQSVPYKSVESRQANVDFLCFETLVKSMISLHCRCRTQDRSRAGQVPDATTEWTSQLWNKMWNVKSSDHFKVSQMRSVDSQGNIIDNKCIVFGWAGSINVWFSNICCIACKRSLTNRDHVYDICHIKLLACFARWHMCFLEHYCI